MADNDLLMRISHDQGQIWSDEIDVTAPGVATVGTWFVTVREPGHVALAYYGQHTGQSGSDAYLTETRNGLESDPVFWSAILNDPTSPVLTSAQGSRMPGPAYLDYNGVDIGPDGTAWGSFVADCPASATDPTCTDASGPKMFAARGFAGRLLWP